VVFVSCAMPNQGTQTSAGDTAGEIVTPRCEDALMHEQTHRNAANEPGLEQSAFLLRSELLQLGYSDNAIQHSVRTRKYERIFEGCYIDLSGSPAMQANARLQAILHRLGPGACLSHSTAAKFHGFDSTLGWDHQSVWASQNTDNRVPTLADLRVTRSRTLAYDRPVIVNQLRFTSRVRTLIDVLATLDLVEGERVLESALRGLDPKRPHVWRTEVLEQLRWWIREHPGQPGIKQAKILLAQRPIGCRPTGSIAETASIQALRGAGFTDVIRQPLVLAPGERGNPREHFLDALVLPYMFDIETDGGDHNDPKRRAEDLKRDRRLAGAFVVLRFTAAEALFTSEVIVSAVREEIQRRQYEKTFAPRAPGVKVTGSDLRWKIDRLAG
jgi:hypothetical protein